jgi:uncharacterized protein
VNPPEIVYIISLMIPEFPDFKPIALEDKDFVQKRLWDYRPETSELSFSNLFMWRAHYGFLCSVYGEWLFIIGGNAENGILALPPIGPPGRGDAARTLLEWVRTERGVEEPHIDRADTRFVSELAGIPEFDVEPARDHFDYVYNTRDLIELAGKNYRAKRNHLNYLLRTLKPVYETMNESHIAECVALAENWCETRTCEEDLSLEGEGDATREALDHFKDLGLDGAVIKINGRVEAFTLGELLNPATAVVHIEKANTEIRGLYALINQQFCERRWKDIGAVNREQDLGEPGLRRAKLSYNPDHMVEKYRVRLVGT